MLKFWLYILVLVVLCVLGLVIGSANETKVTFDFLFIKAEMTTAMLVMVGIIIGIFVGMYLSLAYSMKMWGRAHGANKEVKSLKTQLNSKNAELEQARKAIAQ